MDKKVEIYYDSQGKVIDRKDLACAAYVKNNNKEFYFCLFESLKLYNPREAAFRTGKINSKLEVVSKDCFMEYSLYLNTRDKKHYDNAVILNKKARKN